MRCASGRRRRGLPVIRGVMGLALLAAACGGGGGGGDGTGDAGATNGRGSRPVDQSPDSVSTMTGESTDGGGADAERKEAGDRGSFYLRAADQRSDGRTIVVEEAVFTGTKGWVVVHSQTGGTLGPVIGHSQQLPPGKSTNVAVTFSDVPIASRATVYPMLHVESNDNAEFDFPDADNAASSADGNVVVFPITIELP